MKSQMLGSPATCGRIEEEKGYMLELVEGLRLLASHRSSQIGLRLHIHCC